MVAHTAKTPSSANGNRTFFTPTSVRIVSQTDTLAFYLLNINLFQEEVSKNTLAGDKE